MTIPVVSVLVPTFNYAHYIEECIRSVREQALEQVEIIVVDDCSTDTTEAVVAALRGPDLRYVRHETNSGPAVARNTGLALARGRYIALLDADDVMHRDNLSRKVEILDRHPDVALVHSAAVPIDESGRALVASPVRGTRAGGVQLQNAFPRILYTNPVIASAAVVRKDAIDRVGGFDASLRRAEDWDLWVRLARSFLFAYLDEQLVRVRIHTRGNQWDSFATGHDFQAAAATLRKVFEEFRLEDEGFSLTRIYWDLYYDKLGNKFGVLPPLSFAKLYVDGLRHDPAAALRVPGIKAGIKLAACMVLPRSVIQSWRLRRQARQIAGGRREGHERLWLKHPIGSRDKDVQRRAAV